MSIIDNPAQTQRSLLRAVGYEGLEEKLLMGTRYWFSLISLFIPWQIYTYIEKISVVFSLILLPSSSETLYPNKSLSSYSQGCLCVWPIEFNWVSFWSDEKLGWLHISGSAKSHLMIHLKCLDSMTCGVYFSKAFKKPKPTPFIYILFLLCAVHSLWLCLWFQLWSLNTIGHLSWFCLLCLVSFI